MDSVQAGEVEVCAVEAVTNAIRHAYRGESGHEVSVTLMIRAGKLEVDVSDTGTPMPEHQQSRLVEGSRILEFDPDETELLPEGGMGLQIMHELMDEVSYRREGDVNSLQLIRLLQALNTEGGYERKDVSISQAHGVLQT